MKNILKALVGGVAPVLASALGGPLAGTAIRVLAEKLGLDLSELENDPESVEAQIVKKLESASAADWLAVKNCEQEFLVEMRKLDISEEQIHQMDRQSAREREIRTGDKTPRWLAFLIVAAFIFVVVAQFVLIFKQIQIDPNAVKILDVSTGILLAMLTKVYDYYFGSSAGSARKTEILMKP